MRGPALRIEGVWLLEIFANGREDQPGVSRLAVACAAETALAGKIPGQEEMGFRVNEVNSHLQTGSSGGVCAEPRFPASAREMCPRPDQGGAGEPQTVRGGVQL